MKRLIFIIGIFQVFCGMLIGMEIESSKKIILNFDKLLTDRWHEEFESKQRVLKKYDGLTKRSLKIAQEPQKKSTKKLLHALQENISDEKKKLDEQEKGYAQRCLDSLEKNVAAIQKTIKIFENFQGLDIEKITIEDVEMCDPFFCDSDGSTALSKITRFKKLNFLLDYLIPISPMNHEDKNGLTSFHYAMTSNNPGAVIKFLKYYAELLYEYKESDKIIDIFDVKNKMPQEITLRKLDNETKRLICESSCLAQGEDFSECISDAVVNRGYNPYELLYAIEESDSVKIQELLEDNPSLINKPLANGLLPIEQAFFLNENELLTLMLRKKKIININTKNWHGFSPFFSFALNIRGTIDLIKLAVEDYQANIHEEFVFDSKCSFPVGNKNCLILRGYGALLGYLIELQESDRINGIIKYLLAQKAPYSRNGTTNPLFALALEKKNKFLETFLESKLYDVNEKLPKLGGFTVLGQSIAFENTKAFELLLKYGANPNIPDNFNVTPRDMIERTNNKKIKKIWNKYLAQLKSSEFEYMA